MTTVSVLSVPPVALPFHMQYADVGDKMYSMTPIKHLSDPHKPQEHQIYIQLWQWISTICSCARAVGVQLHIKGKG